MLDQSKKPSVTMLMSYPFPVIRHKGDISIEAMAEVIKAVFKGLLEVAGPAKVKR